MLYLLLIIDWFMIKNGFIYLLVASLSYVSVMQSSVIAVCIFESFSIDNDTVSIFIDISSDCNDSIPFNQPSDEDPIQLVDILETEHFLHSKFLCLRNLFDPKSIAGFYYYDAYALHHSEALSPPPEFA